MGRVPNFISNWHWCNNILKNDVCNHCKNGIKIMDLTRKFSRIASRIIYKYTLCNVLLNLFSAFLSQLHHVYINIVREIADSWTTKKKDNRNLLHYSICLHMYILAYLFLIHQMDQWVMRMCTQYGHWSTYNAIDLIYLPTQGIGFERLSILLRLINFISIDNF